MDDTVKLQIGARVDGGFYAGNILIAEVLYGLAVAPKAHGESGGVWNGSYDDVVGAQSFVDGAENTRAMAKAGSKLAQWSLALSIDGCTDFYLPAIDELEVIYRAFKPTTDTNSYYARSGINLHAVPPTLPYSAEIPAQTGVEAFRQGGEEAFEEAAYWSSTQHAGIPDYAWYQYFVNGSQDYWHEDDSYRGRAVRRFLIR